MIYPVYMYGTSVLRKKAQEIDKNYKELGVFIEDMFETMKKAEGVGLAAPQVGKSIRLFVIDASDIDHDDEEYVEDFKKVFINPIIVEESGKEWVFNEGCLSIPDVREDVSRQEKVRIQYYDQEWNFYDEEYDGIKARIIQHEYDHLEGIMFVDKISPLRKKLLKARLTAISKGKVDIDYKIKF
ncbi:MAG: peptide deformylase [Bacteroidales bacterium]|nr:peptide deformylase [Bacteroidales bacterium]MCF8391632.1 peptide deformylase [Bacteroidales bacterium]